MQILLLLYLAIGLLSILLSIPLTREMVKPNMIYGFRVRATLENPQIWYAVNRHFGKRMLWSGILFLACAVGLYFVPGIGVDVYSLVTMLFFVVPFAIGMVQSMQYLKSLTGK